MHGCLVFPCFESFSALHFAFWLPCATCLTCIADLKTLGCVRLGLQHLICVAMEAAGFGTSSESSENSHPAMIADWDPYQPHDPPVGAALLECTSQDTAESVHGDTCATSCSVPQLLRILNILSHQEHLPVKI